MKYYRIVTAANSYLTSWMHGMLKWFVFYISQVGPFVYVSLLLFYCCRCHGSQTKLPPIASAAGSAVYYFPCFVFNLFDRSDATLNWTSQNETCDYVYVSVLSDEHSSCDQIRADLNVKIEDLRSKYLELSEQNSKLESQRHRLKSVVKQVFPGHNSSNEVTQDELPLIFVVTPTYSRPEQKAELTRLSQTLQLVARVHWIVVEDRDNRSSLVTKLLHRFPHPHTHLTALTPREHKLTEDDPNWRKPRGVFQRNAALRWLRAQPEVRGVLYFADDDNTYDVRLFEEVC